MSGPATSGKSGGSRARKPYVMSKPRETWSEREHNLFVEALAMFTRDWKKIQAHIGTKTAVQIRSHAQKYFQKQVKNGNSAAVPPPRPKRQAGSVRYARSRKRPDSTATAAAQRLPANASSASIAATAAAAAAAASDLSDSGGDGLSASCSGGVPSGSRSSAALGRHRNRSDRSLSTGADEAAGVDDAAGVDEAPIAIRRSKRPRRVTASMAAACEQSDSDSEDEAQPRSPGGSSAEQMGSPLWQPRAADPAAAVPPQQQQQPAPHPAFPHQDAYSIPFQAYYPAQTQYPTWQQMCAVNGVPNPSGPQSGAETAPPEQEAPNFALMYTFLGSLFDNQCSDVDHVAMLAEMSPSTRDTASYCLRNLVANMQQPSWQAHHQQQPPQRHQQMQAVM